MGKTAYIRKNDMTKLADCPDEFRKVFYAASQHKHRNDGSKGGPYFHQDGSWQYVAMQGGNWLDKSELIGALQKLGFEIVDETIGPAPFIEGTGDAAKDRKLADDGFMVVVCDQGTAAIYREFDDDMEPPSYIAHWMIDIEHQGDIAPFYPQTPIFDYKGLKWLWGDFVDTVAVTASDEQFQAFYAKVMKELD